MSDCLQIQNAEISKCGSYIQSNEDGKLARVENIYKQNKAKQEEPQCCHFPPPSATRSLRQKIASPMDCIPLLSLLQRKENMQLYQNLQNYQPSKQVKLNIKPYADLDSSHKHYKIIAEKHEGVSQSEY